MHGALETRGWILAMTLGASSLGCGGGEFGAGQASESTGGGAGGGGGARSSDGGPDDGSGSARSSDAGPDDGSGGGRSGGATGAGGAPASGGRAGAGGGAVSVTDAGPIAEGGVTTVDAGVSRLDLQECGWDAFGTGIKATLYSTLDSVPAILLPAVGELGFVGNPQDDFHGGRCGTAINIDQLGDLIKYHYQDNGVRHFDPRVGTLDFWYHPSYSHRDGLNHHLFGTANWDAVGGIRIRKAAANNSNALQAIFVDSTRRVQELAVPEGSYSFDPGTWVRLTLVWALAPGVERHFARLYLDGALAGEITPPSDFDMNPDPNGFFVAGAWANSDPEHASGMLDELKVFPRGP